MNIEDSIKYILRTRPVIPVFKEGIIAGYVSDDDTPSPFIGEADRIYVSVVVSALIGKADYHIARGNHLEKMLRDAEETIERLRRENDNERELALSIGDLTTNGGYNTKG